jgi:hypothetical protein
MDYAEAVWCSLVGSKPPIQRLYAGNPSPLLGIRYVAHTALRQKDHHESTPTGGCKHTNKMGFVLQPVLYCTGGHFYKEIMREDAGPF